MFSIGLGIVRILVSAVGYVRGIFDDSGNVLVDDSSNYLQYPE